MKCRTALIAIAGALVPIGGAAAQTSSSGTATITVVVPPIAAAIEAAQAGAAGLWTLSEGAETFMVRLPGELNAGGEAELSLYHVPGLVMTVTPARAGAPAPRREETVDLNGLRRETFAIDLGEASSRASAGSSAAFVVATM